ncbi:MAG: hypothetical protein IJ001_02210 [Oscillospiraceae bacterium]|nr:hypothetical protein [Oscillospiraceae bacterium]
MPAPQNFRTAFNGFNREDVVRYLEYINTKHTAQVNQLTSEADYLRGKLENQPSAAALEETVAALTAERDALRSQLEEVQARCDALEEQLTAPVQAETPAEAPAACKLSEELEAYRRAERTERIAQERAAQLYRQVNGVLADATARVDAVAAEVGTVADQVMQQVYQLQTAVTNSKQALQDAAATMYAIRPEDTDI